MVVYSLDKKKLFAEIDKYIEDHYIPDKYDDIVMDQEMKGIFDKLTEFRKKRAIQKNTASHKDVCESESVEPPVIVEADLEAPNFDESSYTKRKLTKPLHEGMVTNRKIEDLMNQLEETFSQRLLRMIAERDLVEADVYKKAYVDRRHFYKIKKDVNYAPNKKTVFAFAIALELSIDETKDLLACAGYALSRSSKFDIIVAYFLQNKIYDMFEINDVLYAYELPVFE